MKALVLAGGVGSRLWPITRVRAKQLLPVANKPVLFYGLEAIAEAGITEVGIVVGETGSAIKRSVADGSALGLSVTCVPQQAPLGLAHAVLIARDYLGDDDFVMYLGDNVIVGGISPLVSEFRAGRPDAQVMLAKVADARAFGVAELDSEDRVSRLAEKPRHPTSDLALVGVYAFTPAIHTAIDNISPSARGELEITDALQWLIDAGHQVAAIVTPGYWKDTGSVSDLLDVNRMMLEDLTPERSGQVDGSSEVTGRVAVGPGARVVRSRIVGPVVIGAGALVRDCRVGPFTSIGENCQVIGAEIENSIVLPGVRIEAGPRIEGWLIDQDARLSAQ